MLKKIIFDLDDTLIMNDKSQIQDYQIVLDKYGHHNISANELYKCIGDYEINTTCYQKDTLLAFINKYFNQNYPIEFIDDIINTVSSWSHLASPDLIEALEYLSQKYELDILTNWFTESQTKRLEQAGIKKYFKNIIGAEKCVKPDPRSFAYFFNDCKPSECVMIGDRFDMDIETPIKLGMKTVLYDVKNRYQDINCVKINNWNEIKNIL